MAEHSIGKGSYVISWSSYAIISRQRPNCPCLQGPICSKEKVRKTNPLKSVDTNIEVSKERHNNENDPG